MTLEDLCKKYPKDTKINVVFYDLYGVAQFDH